MKFLCSLSVLSATLIVGFTKNCYQNDLNDPAVERFRRYIQIDTSNYDNLDQAVEFWRQQAEEIDLPMAVYRPANLPVVVITLQGLDPSLPSIMLNSHMDVVPAEANEWKYPPFSAYVDENGDIYGRGTQDTKDVGIQYFEAIRKIVENNVPLLRTVHITLMPDEEVGGERGIRAFMETDDFAQLNIGFALDEGLASNDDTLYALNQDRRPWQMEFTFFGEGGHGFTMPENVAVEKLNKLMRRFLEFRRQNIEKMKSLDPLDYGAMTSVNINELAGGVAINVIPTNMTLGVDMRLSTDSNVTEIENMIKSWMYEAGNDTDLYFIRREDVSKKTVLNNENLYWVAMKEAINELGYEIVELVCPATTDMLPLRNIGIPAVGFAPKIRTTSRVHGKDEYLNIDIFRNGINIYYEIIKKLANVGDNTLYKY